MNSHNIASRKAKAKDIQKAELNNKFHVIAKSAINFLCFLVGLQIELFRDHIVNLSEGVLGILRTLSFLSFGSEFFIKSHCKGLHDFLNICDEIHKKNSGHSI